MDSSAHTVGVAALVLGMLAAFSLTKGAAEKEERPASTREPSPARDGEVCFRITKRVSWHEQVFVHYVEPLEVQQIVSPELMLEGIVQEISQITGDEGMRVVSRQLAVTKREMAQKISRFSSEHGHSIDGYEKVWDIIALNQRLLRLQEDLDDLVGKGLPSKGCDSEAFRRCTRLKAHYRATRSSMENGEEDDHGIGEDDDEDREYAYSFA